MVKLRAFQVLIALGLALTLLACSSSKIVAPEVDNFDPAKEFKEANDLFDSKTWADARQKYLSIKLRDTTGKLVSMAQLRIADTYFEEGEPDQAIDEYRKFLEIFPSDRYAYYAQYQIAMIYYTQIKGGDRAYSLAERSLAEFKKLNETYPRNPYRELVETKIEHCRTLLADHEFMVAKYYFERVAYAGAIERALNVYEYYPSNPNVPEALYYLVASYKRTGQKEKAEQYYAILKEKHPRASFTEKAAAELAKPDVAAAPEPQAKPAAKPAPELKK